MPYQKSKLFKTLQKFGTWTHHKFRLTPFKKKYVKKRKLFKSCAYNANDLHIWRKIKDLNRKDKKWKTEKEENKKVIRIIMGIMLEMILGIMLRIKLEIILK